MPTTTTVTDQNKAFIDGQGNITVQGNSGDVTINVNDPKLEEKLAQHGQSIDVVKQLLVAQMGSIGGVEIQLTQLLKRFPAEKDIPLLLRQGSRAHFEYLTGPKGRFEHLGESISEQEFHHLGKVAIHILADLTTEATKVKKDAKSNYKTRYNEKSKSSKEKSEEEEKIKFVQELLSDLWQSEHTHALITGDGGMGKTVTMLWLWKTFLSTENPTTIPIYIPLNQYNQASKAEQEKFITSYIAQHYLGVRILENDTEARLWKWLDQPNPKKQHPRLLLFLDGLNEISSDITPLLIDLNEKWIKTANEGGIQILVSSRYNSNHKFTDGFEKWPMQPLKDYCIGDYLNQNTKIVFQDISPSLQELLRTPMLLTLFAGVQKASVHASISDLKPSIHSSGELLWNYIEMKLARFEQDNFNDPEKGARSHFLVQFLLPFIAYWMEEKKLEEIKEKELEMVINEAYLRFYEPDFFREFKSHRKHIKKYRKHINALQIGQLPLLEEIDRFEGLMRDFTHELFPVTHERNTLRFSHQSFLDFFAAKHILNELHLCLEKKNLPILLKERILPANLRKMLGEITGEDHNTPDLLPPDKKWKDYFEKTCLVEVLDLCRGINDREKLGHIVWNILTIWKEVRGTLSGADFSNLHLCGFDFNGVCCSQMAPNGELVESTWDNCRLSPKQWFPQGHQNAITKVRVSPDGKYLITASGDHTIKLWNLATHQYIRSFQSVHGHEAKIFTIAFSPDCSRILSGAADHKVIEWSVETGECLQVFRGHEKTIREVVYHPVSAKVLSASDDGTVREWSSETGKCLQTYDFSKNGKVQAVCYLNEGRSFLAALEEGTVIECSTDKRAQLLQKGEPSVLSRLDEKGVFALALSPCTYKVLTLSIDKEAKAWTIREWAVGTGEFIQHFKFQNPPEPRQKVEFVDITYDPSGQYVLVAGLDDHIYEWSVTDPIDRNERYITQVFCGHARRASSVAYHPNGIHFFSGSYEATAKKWSTVTGQYLHTFQPRSSPFNSILDVPDSSSLVLGSEDGFIHLWDVGKSQPRLLKTFQAKAPAYSMAIYRQAERDVLITGGEWGIIQGMTLEGEHLWDFDEHKDTISCLALDQESGRIVSVDVKGNIIMWSLENDHEVKFYPKQEEAVTHVCFSPATADNRFATSTKDGFIRLWSTDSIEPLKTYRHTSPVFTIDFDGHHILFGGADGQIKEWNIDSGKVALLWEHKTVLYVAYSPDRKKIIVAEYGSNQLIDLPFSEGEKRAIDYKKLKHYTGHRDYILSAKYSKDSQIIWTVSQDATLKAWDRETTQQLWSVENIPGLKVTGLHLKKVHWTEPLTDREWDSLQFYGAILTEPKQIESNENFDSGQDRGVEKKKAPNENIPPPPPAPGSFKDLSASK